MYHNVPKHILDALKGEPVDFIVQSAQDYRKRIIGWVIIIFAIPFSGFFLFPFLFSLPLIELSTVGKSTITVNGVPQTFTPENPWFPILFALIPALFLFIFDIPLFIALYVAIKFIRKKGPWYAGTNKNLVEFNGQSAHYYHWDEFDKAIQTKLNRDNTLDIFLVRKTPNISVHQRQPASSGKHKDTVAVVDINSLSISRFIFMNKIGLLSLENGSLVLNMIRHNMERFKKESS